MCALKKHFFWLTPAILPLFQAERVVGRVRSAVGRSGRPFEEVVNLPEKLFTMALLRLYTTIMHTSSMWDCKMTVFFWPFGFDSSAVVKAMSALSKIQWDDKGHRFHRTILWRCGTCVSTWQLGTRSFVDSADQVDVELGPHPKRVGKPSE